MPFSTSLIPRRSALSDSLSGRAIDLLVCNAGVYLDKGMSLSDGFDADTWAALRRQCHRRLPDHSGLPAASRPRPAPKIAIISSQMGSSERAPGGSYIYRASKAAATNLGRNLAADLAPRGIAVGIYHPGWVRTDMGGASADISEHESVSGLIARFDDLSMETTGAFLTWDGRPHPF
jgi:NAD(P)-dependent dehydrogenase (short-subunit alcohol dehydrogenase family)